MSLIAELKRRNVVRMAGLYLVGAWLIVQVSGTVLPMFGAPAWVPRTIVIVLAIAFLPALVFAWVFELTPQGLKRDAEVPSDQSIAPQTARRMNRAFILVLTLALSYFALDKFLMAPRREAMLVAQTSRAAKADATKSVSTAREPSIAVLPFINLSNDPEQTYFSDGLAEDLITTLSQFQGLKVIGRSSSFRFRDSKEDSKTIGAQLGVVHLLTGSVRRAGDQVRISADLVDVADGRTLWSQRYDRPYTDLFKLQDEITAAVARSLSAKLLSGGHDRIIDDRPPSGSLQAYNAYLQGRYYGLRNSSEDYLRAFGYYRQAIALDPGYARAHAGLAQSLVYKAAVFDSGAEARDGVKQARAEADIALRLAPDQAWSHSANARVLANGELRWVEAEAESRRALELAPNDPVAISTQAQHIGILGRTRESVALAQRAVQLDPLDANNWYWLSFSLCSLGRVDEAWQAAERASELQPTSPTGGAQRAIVQIVRGDNAAAVAEAQRIAPGNWHDIGMALATQRAGDRDAADRALQVLIQGNADASAYQIAEAYALREQPDKVFEWLERAWIQRDPGLRRLLYDPFLGHLHGDPRFVSLLRKIGLPPPSEPVVAVVSP